MQHYSYIVHLPFTHTAPITTRSTHHHTQHTSPHHHTQHSSPHTAPITTHSTHHPITTHSTHHHITTHSTHHHTQHLSPHTQHLSPHHHTQHTSAHITTSPHTAHAAMWLLTLQIACPSTCREGRGSAARHHHPSPTEFDHQSAVQWVYDMNYKITCTCIYIIPYMTRTTSHQGQRLASFPGSPTFSIPGRAFIWQSAANDECSSQRLADHNITVSACQPIYGVCSLSMVGQSHSHNWSPGHDPMLFLYENWVGIRMKLSSLVS